MIININIRGFGYAQRIWQRRLWVWLSGAEPRMAICWYGQRWSSQVLVLLGRCCRVPYEGYIPRPWWGYAQGASNPQAVSKEQEIELLKAQADAVKAQLDAIEARVRELEGK
ncbi:MAG: DUF5320 family protein [Acetomicrobium sp.]